MQFPSARGELNDEASAECESDGTDAFIRFLFLCHRPTLSHSERKKLEGHSNQGTSRDRRKWQSGQPCISHRLILSSTTSRFVAYFSRERFTSVALCP